MTPRFIVLLLQIFFIVSCSGRSTPAGPPKLPKAAAGGATLTETALVWIVSLREPEFPEAQQTGQWEETAPVRTYWVAPVGNTWVVVSWRPGLFVAVGSKVSEVVLTRYRHHLTQLPPATEQDSEQLKECRELIEANAELDGLYAKGSGLTLRDLSSDARTPLLPVPASLEALDYPFASFRNAHPLGSLGSYLFVRVFGYAESCGRLRAVDVEDFEILDLAQGKRVTDQFWGSGGEKPWKKYFDLPERRVELAPMMKRQLREYDPGTADEYDPANLYVRHFYPVFSTAAANVAFQVAYRYWAGCRACPSFDGFALAEDLPPELQDAVAMHPAIEAARAALPKEWRLGGFSVLSTTPAETTRLRALFESR